MLAAAPTQCQEKRPVAHSPKRKLFLDLVLSLFRLNGLLVSEGDNMARAVGLTSARWKVIGVIALAHSGVTVPRSEERRVGEGCGARRARDCHVRGWRVR